MNLRGSVKIAMALALIGLGAAVIIPNFVRVRMTRAQNTCLDVNLKALAEAKNNWATQNAKAPGTVPDPSDILPYLPGRKMPECPAGGAYHIGPVGTLPSCSFNHEALQDLPVLRATISKPKSPQGH